MNKSSPYAASWLPRADSVRASIAGGSARVRTSLVIGATMTPSSIARAWSSVGRSANLLRSDAGMSCPPADSETACRASCSLAKSLITLAAAPGSSFANASRIGPLSVSCMHSKVGAFDGPARQRVLDNTHVYTGVPRFLTQGRHFRNRQTPVLRCNSRQGVARNRVYLFDKCLSCLRVSVP